MGRQEVARGYLNGTLCRPPREDRVEEPKTPLNLSSSVSSAQPAGYGRLLYLHKKDKIKILIKVNECYFCLKSL